MGRGEGDGDDDFSFLRDTVLDTDAASGSSSETWDGLKVLEHKSANSPRMERRVFRRVDEGIGGGEGREEEEGGEGFTRQACSILRCRAAAAMAVVGGGAKGGVDA